MFSQQVSTTQYTVSRNKTVFSVELQIDTPIQFPFDFWSKTQKFENFS